MLDYYQVDTNLDVKKLKVSNVLLGREINLKLLLKNIYFCFNFYIIHVNKLTGNNIC